MTSYPEPIDRLEEARRELESALAEIQESVPVAALQQRRRTGWIWPTIAAGVGLVIALGIKRKR